MNSSTIPSVPQENQLEKMPAKIETACCPCPVFGMMSVFWGTVDAGGGSCRVLFILGLKAWTVTKESIKRLERKIVMITIVTGQ